MHVLLGLWRMDAQTGKETLREPGYRLRVADLTAHVGCAGIIPTTPFLLQAYLATPPLGTQGATVPVR